MKSPETKVLLNPKKFKRNENFFGTFKLLLKNVIELKRFIFNNYFYLYRRIKIKAFEPAKILNSSKIFLRALKKTFKKCNAVVNPDERKVVKDSREILKFKKSNQEILYIELT